MSNNLKSRTVTVVLASIPYTGWLGVDRFYLGRYFTGVLKLLLTMIAMSGSLLFMTEEYDGSPIFSIMPIPFLFGMFAWYIADIVYSCSRAATDRWGRPLQRRQPRPYGMAYMPPNQPNPIPQAFPGVNAGMQNNSYQNQMNPGFYPAAVQAPASTAKKGKNKALYIVGIVAFAVIILMAAFIVFSTDFVKSVTESVGYKNEMVFHDLKVKYPVDWFKNSTDPDTISLTKSGRKGRITFTYDESVVYYNSDDALNKFMEEYEELWDRFELIGQVQDVTTNNIQWKKIEFNGELEGENRKCMQMVYAAGYEVYSILYIAKEENFEKYLDETNQIISSASLPVKETNTQAVKQQILGEWDCGDTGYLVINSDNTYCIYRDKSKSADNVVSGVYEATDGIATNAAGYAKGITFITTIKKCTIDGKDQPAYVDGKVAYAFTPDGTGNFIGNNLNTGSSFKMKKVR